MEILKTNSTNPKKIYIEKIAKTLSRGKIVVLPTETIYTFAVDATNARAVKKVYELKGRDFKKPLHVVASSLTMASHYVYVNDLAKKLAEKFLPGPLTLVLKKRESTLPKVLTSGLSTLGIRIPNLPLNKKVSELFQKPYTTTSANISGGSNPYSINDIFKQLSKAKTEMISLAVDVGSLPNLLPSTLIDLTTRPPKILRQGPITKPEIEKASGVDII